MAATSSQGATSAAHVDASTGPERSGLVLASLIIVAAVANLNLAVANVALPSIGAAFDSSQTTLDLIAVGYSLGLAASVLYLGALGDRYGRKLMLVLGMALSIPASLLAAYAPTDNVLVVARILGGVSAGMAYPTTLALITALWSGPARTRSIALWSALGGAIASLGPLVSGWLLGQFWWGSVFLVTLPLAIVALVMAVRFVPAHVNETSDPVDNLGGILSVLLVGAAILAINFAPVPNEGALVIGLIAIAVAAGIAFVIRQQRARNPLYDLHIAGRRIFWVAALAGIIVFGSLMGAMFIGQQFLQNVLGYAPVDAGAAILPAALLMIIVAPRSARLVDDPRGSIHLAPRLRLLPARLPDDAGPVGRRQPVLAGRTGLCPHRDRSRIRRDARIALADRVGPGRASRDGLRDGGPPTRPRRRDHAVDLRRPADGRVRSRRCRGHLDGTERRPDHEQHGRPARAVILQRERDRGPVPGVRDPDHRGRQDVVPGRRGLAYTPGSSRSSSGSSSSTSASRTGRERLLAAYHARTRVRP